MTVESSISRCQAVMLTIFFAVAISLPLCKQITFGEPKTEATEGRRLNEMPKIAWKRFSTVKAFPVDFEGYFNDHFGFRAALLKMRGYVGVRLFNIPLSPNVIIGKNGWLFYGGSRSVEKYQGLMPFRDEDLDDWVTVMQRKQDWLARRGVRYLFVIPPDKHTIYPEFMPDKYYVGNRRTRLDQLLEYLASHHSNVNVLSLREPLLKAKAGQRERLYYPLDTHWNSVGAFFAYRAITARLREWFPEMKPLELSDFSLRHEYNRGDLARMGGLDISKIDEPVMKLLKPAPASKEPFDLAGYTPPMGVYFTIRNPDASTARRAIIIRDSYTNALIPMLSKNFSQVTYLALSVEKDFEKALATIIERDKPDILIEERLERFIPSIPDKKNVFGGSED